MMSYFSVAQVLNEPANWPNNNWTITGNYLTDPNVFEADPTTSSNFSYDDDDAQNGNDDNIEAESPVIDLTAAYNAGETTLQIVSAYTFRNIGELLTVQYWDNDAANWVVIGDPLAGTTTGIDDNFCNGSRVPFVSELIDISGFTPSQLQNFKYRISYDDNNIWGWGFCFDSPVISSQAPAVCPSVSNISITYITLDSAQVFWDAGGLDVSWEIVVQASGTGLPAGSGTSTSTNNPHVLTGLNNNTSYEVYVRGFCGGTDYSNWVGPVNFTTLIPSRVNFSLQAMGIGGYDLTVVDMNGDHLDDIVSATTSNVNIHYQLSSGGFDEVNISTPNADYLPGWSMAAADFNKDGYTDLLYGSGSGVTFMRSDGTGNGFVEVSGPQDVFSQRSNFVDLNQDGNLDAFVCHDVDPNVYYMNDGSGNLTFNQGGLGDDEAGGNYGSIWIDYDNDRDMDMFIAKCRGGATTININEMHENDGSGNFTEVASTLGLADPIQTWSSAWGDFDNDGDMDVFVGASSTANGTHKLMRNNGNSTFTDVTSTSGILPAFTNTGHENATYDFDNDGNLDIASNGSILFGNGDLTFTVHDNMLGITNGSFGDMNNDGFIDAILGTNLYTNDTNSNNWVKITTTGVASNINGIGARVELHTASGVQIRDVRSGEGFRYMSTLNTHFGIGTETEITNLIIYWPSGTIDNIMNPTINTHHIITEGQALSIEDETLFQNITIHPNPVGNLMNIDSPVNLIGKIATIFNIEGKRMMNLKLEENKIDVSSLRQGNYILRLESNGKVHTQKFIKQ